MSINTLYIEDNEVNQYLVDFLLTKNGHSVTLAATGPKGIELAKRLKPELILLDIQLPHMDGYQVLERLRKIPELEQTPVIAVTSYAMMGDFERIMALGCNGYISKPINPDTFVEQIEQHLKRDGD